MTLSKKNNNQLATGNCNSLLRQMYGVDTMARLLETELENAQDRYATLLKTGRDDAIARIVLNRMKEEITSLERSITNEEEPGEEVFTRTSTSRVTRCIRETMHRYWVKCYRNNNTIPAIPTVSALQEARATT